MKKNIYDIHSSLTRVRNLSRRRLAKLTFDRKKELIKKYVTGGRILEIGPGPDREFWKVLSGLSREIYSVDINIELLEGQNIFPNIKIIGMDGCQTAFKPHLFDFVICSEVLEHIPEVSKFLKEIKRIKTKDGLLILSTPSPHSPLEIFGKIARLKGIKRIASLLYREMIDKAGHISLTSNKVLKKYFKKQGWEVIEEDKVGFCIPLLAEFLPQVDIKMSQFLERYFRKNIFLRNFLWDQIFILR